MVLHRSDSERRAKTRIYKNDSVLNAKLSISFPIQAFVVGIAIRSTFGLSLKLTSIVVP